MSEEHLDQFKVVSVYHQLMLIYSRNLVSIMLYVKEEVPSFPYLYLFSINTATTSSPAPSTTRKPDGCTNEFSPPKGLANAYLQLPAGQYYVIEKVTSFEDCTEQCTYQPRCKSITWNRRQQE